MSQITTAFSGATSLFAVAVVLFILVTGFFLGRKWLNRAGYDWDAHSPAENEEHYYKTGEVHPAYAARIKEDDASDAAH